MSITPAALAQNGTEDGHQKAIFCWAARRLAEDPIVYAELEWFHAIPNGGSRGDSKKSAMIVGGNLKAMGTKAGIADMFLPTPANGVFGLYIELKRAEGSLKDASEAQIRFRDWAQDRNYGWALAYGWKEAVTLLIQYLALPDEDLDNLRWD